MVLTYDPSDGNLSVNGNGVRLTTLEIKSASEAFIPANANDGVFNPPFDVASPAKLFTLKTEGFATLDFGSVLPPSLTVSSLLADLSVSGSILPSGTLSDAPGGGPYIGIPEPQAAALMLLGLLGFSFRRRG